MQIERKKGVFFFFQFFVEMVSMKFCRKLSHSLPHKLMRLWWTEWGWWALDQIMGQMALFHRPNRKFGILCSFIVGYTKDSKG